MLNCQACMKRCIRAVISESISSSQTTPKHITSSSTGRNIRRNFNTYASEPQPAISNSGAGWPNLPPKKSLVAAHVPSRSEPRPPAQAPSLELRRYAVQQLPYLSDPLKLAEFVAFTLSEKRGRSATNDDFEKARAVVRMASRNTQCTVSWNRLIGWQMSKGQMNAAFKTYNEMKKRAQIPDAHTYTAIFKGCAESPYVTQALPKCLSMYHSMFADHAPVKATTIHMNAVLKACANAGDLDALWGVAQQFPAKGARAPDAWTYTIILKAVRTHAIDNREHEISAEESKRNQFHVVKMARNLWVDISRRSRQGDLIIDELLVSTMGRILIMGDERDQDDILSLIEQTMRIPRQIPPLGTPERSQINPGSQGLVQPLNPSQNDLAEGLISKEGPPNSSEQHNGVSHTLSQTSIAKSPKSSPFIHVKPSQNSLSLIMDALLLMKAKDAATKYWIIWTQQMVPDAPNFHAYMRILRTSRASAAAVQLLEDMPPEIRSEATFIIAMSTCSRDKRNRNAFRHAERVLSLMNNSLSVPSARVLSKYLDVANAHAATAKDQLLSSKDINPQHIQGEYLLAALTKVKSLFDHLSRYLTSTKNQPTTIIHMVKDLGPNMISLYDQLLTRNMVPKSSAKDISRDRSHVAAFITKYNDGKRMQTRRPQGKSLLNEEVD